MSDRSHTAGRPRSEKWADWIWLVVGVATFALAASVAYELDFTTSWATVNSLVPPLVFVSMVVFFLTPFFDLPAPVRVLAVVGALGGWAITLFDDDRWTILTFAMFAVAYSHGRLTGRWLSGFVSFVWGLAWIVDGSPLWTLTIPVGVFAVGILISDTIDQAERENKKQADLIRQLTAAQDELAASERAKGVLEERARVASEIHDTLAQGFTSIVLLARAAQRSGEVTDGLSAIEDTAQENLEAARRLVEAIEPPELEAGSLPDALDRHRHATLSPELTSTFRVVGTPRRLTGAVEVTLLRAAQEALLNVENHARAENVDITLSYLDDVVALDVRDDGIGFSPGSVTDRGSLTGGQGLRVLERRASSLAGELTIEAMEGGGSVVSVLLPSSMP